ncbi:hypothetical protein Aros01_09437 [Streptosporangium roseum]
MERGPVGPDRPGGARPGGRLRRSGPVQDRRLVHRHVSGPDRRRPGRLERPQERGPERGPGRQTGQGAAPCPARLPELRPAPLSQPRHGARPGRPAPARDRLQLPRPDHDLGPGLGTGDGRAVRRAVRRPGRRRPAQARHRDQCGRPRRHPPRHLDLVAAPLHRGPDRRAGHRLVGGADRHLPAHRRRPHPLRRHRPAHPGRPRRLRPGPPGRLAARPPPAGSVLPLHAGRGRLHRPARAGPHRPPRRRQAQNRRRTPGPQAPRPARLLRVPRRTRPARAPPGRGPLAGGRHRRRRRGGRRGAGAPLRPLQAAAAEVRPGTARARQAPADPHQPSHPARRLVHPAAGRRAVRPLHRGRAFRGPAVQGVSGVAGPPGPRGGDGGLGPGPGRPGRSHAGRPARPRRPGAARPRHRRARRRPDPGAHHAGPHPLHHAEHGHAGRLRAAARPAHRRRRRRLRRHRLRPPARAARRRADGGPVHQHAAGPGTAPPGRTGGRPAPQAPRRAGRAAGPPPPRAERDPARRPVRHAAGDGELPPGPAHHDRGSPADLGGRGRRDPLSDHAAGHPGGAAPLPAAVPARRVHRGGGRGAAGPVPAPAHHAGRRAGHPRRPPRRSLPRRAGAAPARMERYGGGRTRGDAGRAVRGTGRADPGRDGAGVRGRGAELRRVQRAGEPAGAAAGRARGRARAGGGADAAPVAGPAGRDVRRGQGGRRLPADRSRPPGREDRVDARRRAPGPRHRPRLAGRRGRVRMFGGEPGGTAGAGQPRLRDLHLGLDRTAQGRRGLPPVDRQPPAVGAVPVRPARRRPGPAEDTRRVRRVGLGVLLAAPDRRRPGDRPARRPPGPGLPRRADRRRTRHDRPLRPVHARRLPRRLGRPGAGLPPAGHLQRRGAPAGGRRPGGRAAGRPGAQPLRPDRGRGGRHLLGAPPRSGRRVRPDRPPGLEHPRLRAGSVVAAGSGGSGRGALPGRGAAGAGVSGAWRVDGGAVRGVSVRGSGGADVPDG